MILTTELCNPATRGYNDGTFRTNTSLSCGIFRVLMTDLGLLGGMVIGLPAVMNYGTPELKAKVMPEIFAGKKVIDASINSGLDLRLFPQI